MTETLTDRAKVIIANWANALPESRRGARTWSPEDIAPDLPTRAFNVMGFKDVDLLTTLRNDLRLAETPRWGDTFGEIFNQIENATPQDDTIVSPAEVSSEIRKSYPPFPFG